MRLPGEALGHPIVLCVSIVSVSHFDGMAHAVDAENLGLLLRGYYGVKAGQPKPGHIKIPVLAEIGHSHMRNRPLPPR